LEVSLSKGFYLNLSPSFRFHGKGPGKKQIEKRQEKRNKKERMKKMNSMDTPLGTLAKQKKLQEQTHSAYLLLSGSKGNEIG
jgi:U4/U6.U5 tri-snRNP-associated protein 1